jgi:hypothetical protein
VNFPERAESAGNLAEWQAAIAQAIDAAQADLTALSGIAERSGTLAGN